MTVQGVMSEKDFYLLCKFRDCSVLAGAVNVVEH